MINIEGLDELEALKVDGYDDAVLGLVEVFTPEGRNPRLLYDYDKMVDICAAQMEGGDEDDDERRRMAEEYVEFNIMDAYMGPSTPAFLIRRVDNA